MSDGDYVLGTDATEIDRLRLQHHAWRAPMFKAWETAGIQRGDCVFDIGAGPGFASLDLAELVGSEGRIVALERAQNYVDFLSHSAARHGLNQLEIRMQDVELGEFGHSLADASWCRWVLCFCPQARRVVSHIVRALKPGGVAIFHEYVDYASWRALPPNEQLDRFVALVMRSWRDTGSEPNVARQLPVWLRENGCELLHVRPIAEVLRRSDFRWRWLESYVETGPSRLHELGYISAAEARRLSTALKSADAGALMMAPTVLEVIARKR